MDRKEEYLISMIADMIREIYFGLNRMATTEELQKRYKASDEQIKIAWKRADNEIWDIIGGEDYQKKEYQMSETEMEEIFIDQIAYIIFVSNGRITTEDLQEIFIASDEQLKIAWEQAKRERELDLYYNKLY